MSVMMTALTCAAIGSWTTTEGSRILAMQVFGGKSQWNLMSGILRTLVDSGHDVTAFTPYPDGAGGGGDRSRGNYTEVDVSDVVTKMRDVDLEDQVRRFGDSFDTVGPLVAMDRQVCDRFYGHPEMKRLLGRADVHPATSSDVHFDVVLISSLLTDCGSFAARRFRSPLIYVLPLSDVGAMERYTTGHFPDPAVQSHVMAHHAVPRTFAHRLTDAFTFAYWEVASAYHNAKLRRVDPKEFDTVETVRPSLVFVNGHFTSNAPSAVPAEVINVGGIHLKSADPLPQEILEFIEQSTRGVICFTLGSTVKMSTLPKNIIKSFMDVISQVPQRVLLKYENDMKDKPKNVMTVKWLPQRDILLHPNVKLFISHGGISGLYEAVDAGVPVLGFPLFSDQYRNIESLVDTGMAISMGLFTVTKDVFLNNVLELLNNETYTKNAKIASEIFKDRPLSPSEQVVYWTEYVIRHKGAPHLKSHALNLAWYQYYLLDVIIVVLIIVSVFLFITYKILKSIIKYVLNSSRKNVKTKSE